MQYRYKNLKTGKEIKQSANRVNVWVIQYKVITLNNINQNKFWMKLSNKKTYIQKWSKQNGKQAIHNNKTTELNVAQCLNNKQTEWKNWNNTKYEKF